jgi:hypothetical protein
MSHEDAGVDRPSLGGASTVVGRNTRATTSSAQNPPLLDRDNLSTNKPGLVSIKIWM